MGFIHGFSPVTVFAPDNLAWKNFDLTPDEAAALILNHVFEGMFSAEMLLGMDGQSITSVNGRQFLVNVADGVVTIRGIGEYSELAKANVLAADILGSTGILHRVDNVIQDTPLRLSTDAPTSSPTMPATSDASQLTLSGDVVLEDATQIPADDTAIPTETIGPSDVVVLETPSPSAFGSFEDTTIMEENDSNGTNFLNSGETLVPGSLWNETNVTEVPAEMDADDEPSMSPETMIDVEPETAWPTSAVSSPPTADSEEAGGQVAVSSTSDAPNRDDPATLLLSGVVVLSFLLVAL